MSWLAHAVRVSGGITRHAVSHIQTIKGLSSPNKLGASALFCTFEGKVTAKAYAKGPMNKLEGARELQYPPVCVAPCRALRVFLHRCHLCES